MSVDKTLLESEIRRLSAQPMEVIFEKDSLEGLEINEVGGRWMSTDLNVTHTLANWRSLPNGCGARQAWINLVDSDWNDALNRNMGID